MYPNRWQKLYTALHKAGLDALVLNPSPTLTYLTGLPFHLMERPIVGIFRPEHSLVLILPELERAKAEDLPYPVDVYTYGEDPSRWGETFQRAAHAAGLRECRVGVEPTRLRYLELRYLEAAAPSAAFVSGENVIASLRMNKDAEEIASMRQAVRIAQQALQAALQNFRVGMQEKELGAELVLQLLRHGSEANLPFYPIIASGPNSANPHAAQTERPIQPGDLLIIDWGATVNGYFSDLTRTFAIGEVDPELAHIAAVVHQANQAGLEAARPGIPAGEVDLAARKVIEAAGYGAYFIHRTGHGLGLDTHEPPYMYAQNPIPLEAGMTFTIEPGIYLPGRGGVRIEDDVVITKDGAESLSDLPRQLQTLA
ncbi:MAG: aminopeptidase P family protein [Anaerolineae bacterium]|nr:MAG: aminopeptidase P family protein [Anaerolineae bacterium]